MRTLPPGLALEIIDERGYEGYSDAWIADVLQERLRQIEKWGAQRDHTYGMWLAILSEEVGEVSRAILGVIDGEPAERVRAELVQVAAVALAWLESIDTWNGARGR